MPFLRFDRWLLTVVVGLTTLFTILDPPASTGLSLAASGVFWFLHIGAGMLMAVAATAALTRWAMPILRRPAVRIAAGGLIGSLLFAPFALAVDHVWPVQAEAADADDLLDLWEARGGAWALLAEWLSLLPPYLTSWLLVNAVPLASVAASPVDIERSPAAPIDPAQPAEPTVLRAADRPVDDGMPFPAIDTASAAFADAPAESEESAESVESTAEQTPETFLALLPPAIGEDLISIQADLHYLQIRTTRGRAMVLASLSTAEQALSARGLRVHRSHWVALAHVRRLVRSANGTSLQLSDGSKIPVSRRRASEVQARLGHSFVVESA